MSPDQPTPVRLSPEFLVGNTEVGLEKIRTRLLDLTSRNRLLNFRHTSASSLRVTGAHPTNVFRRLMDGETLAFLPVPEPDEYVSGQKPTANEQAKLIGWPTSYDLDDLTGNGDPNLPVLHYVEQLQTLTRKIGSAAKTAIEESGTNMLYLVLGFLEWYEADDSQQARLAPLVTVPASLDRSAGRGAGFRCTIEHSGEDLATNLSLVERMRRDFGLEVPQFDGDETVEEYFGRFQPLLNQKRRWRIRRQITLTLLSFGKLLMYRDLDPKTWPGIVAHPRVKELFEGRKSDTVEHADEFDIDAPEVKRELPPIIYDADSSQHSALIHALRGGNLVIEGPPGTGKSQTITNLIGAALVQDKTVLFVAEKLAALQVVRKRLDDAGLGIFCLELHSNKTKKHALLNDLEGRIKARASFEEPQGYDHVLAVLEEKRQALNQYVVEINRRIQPFDAAVFDVIWARDRYRQELPFTRQLTGNVPNAMAFTRTDYAHKEAFLAVYAEHLGAVRKVSPDPGQHPWSWVRGPLTFDQEETLINHLRQIRDTAVRLGSRASSPQWLSSVCAITSLRDVDRLRTLVRALPEEAPASDPELLSACLDEGVVSDLRSFTRDTRAACGVLASLADVVINPEEFVKVPSPNPALAGRELLNKLGISQTTVEDLRLLLANLQAALKHLADARGALHNINTALGVQVELNTRSIELLLCCVRVLESAPLDLLHLRSAALEQDGVEHILRSAMEEHSKLVDEASQLGATFDVRAAGSEDVRELHGHAKVLANAGFIQSLFGRNVRLAKRTYGRLTADRVKRSRAKMARDMRKLADFLQAQRRFDQDSRYRQTFGPHYAGTETKWSDFERIIGWYREVFQGLPDHEAEAEPLRAFLFRSRTDRLRYAHTIVATRTEDRGVLSGIQVSIDTISSKFPELAPPSRSLGEIQRGLETFAASLSNAIDKIVGAGYRSDVSLASIPEAITNVERYRSTMRRLTSQERIRELLGDRYRGLQTDLGEIDATTDYVDKICRTGLSTEAVTWLLAEQQRGRLQHLRSWLSERISDLGSVEETITKVGGMSGCPDWSKDGPANDLKWCSITADRALASADHLPHWIHFVRVQLESEAEGLAKLTALADARHMEPEHLVPAFRFLFYDSLTRAVFAERPILSRFAGVTMSEVRRQFADLDRRSIILQRQRAAATIDRRRVPFGRQSGPVGTWTDLALIAKEISKQKRHIPIRQLVRRSGSALQALKPCFMMGPLSVAQYLAPGELSFDLIVMDEASQLKPEDAIGALARGGQMVIVGDPKQLPPTTFFQRAAMDAEADEDEQNRTVAEEGESILDVASTLYQPVRRLRWHYRSRHHSLIAFSNKEFYQGDLVIFPSAYHERSDLGVKYHQINGGVFENGRNPVEAARIVTGVLEHMERRPNESLGVVALNFEQSELIEELLDQRLRSDPFAVAYQEKMNGGPEPFFIKNLENVQGDERDVIFISATYGPDARGNQYQRFGPLNGSNGHRRLNVLFTRAKKRTEVFSSLDPDKIVAGPGSAWGLRALKEYLQFARSGVLAPADGGTGPAVNDFERSVGAVLMEKGYEVVPQVGVAGFFIDLAVKHPTKPGSYLLGIECDGASYHSGRSARDRDRLREEILVNLGWKIHRIWSTDWFKSRGSEIERLLANIHAVLAADPEYHRERTKQAQTDALRQALIAIRTEERQDFPEAATGRCLLRNELIEEFILRRPKSKADWFRKIPPELRAGTEAKHVGKYLERVLAVIAEHS